MLIPKPRLCHEGDGPVEVKFFVWSVDDCGFIENKIFGKYDTKEECQAAIDYANSFHVIKTA